MSHHENLNSPTEAHPTSDTPCVTVVTPIHNAERWLDDTINSVRAQTYDHLRYILLDDNSTDSSREIASRHAQEDGRLEVVAVHNGSVAKTRQMGVDMADSPFVAFLDHDDVWRPEFLERSVEHLRKLGGTALGVYCLIGLIDEHGQPIYTPRTPADGQPEFTMSGRVDLDNYLLGDFPPKTAGAIVMRKSALEGHAFSQAAEPSEDHELWLRILDAHPGGIYYGIEEILMDYRLHESQQTSNLEGVYRGADHILATYVPRMQDPNSRWQVYQYAGGGAKSRGCPKYAQHFYLMAERLADDPTYMPPTLDARIEM